jgi:hypothetical protein
MDPKTKNEYFSHEAEMRWIPGVSKAVFGLVLGYALLFVYVSIFQLGLLPIAQAISSWIAT